MKYAVDDLRIKEIKELHPPQQILREIPETDAASRTTWASRQAIHRVLHGADDRLVVVIGPSCSNAAMPGAPILGKAGIPSIGLNSVPAITEPDRDPIYNWYTRTAFNDSWSALSDADYAYNTAGARRVIALHDGTSYSESVAKHFAEAFKAQGGEVISIEAGAPRTSICVRP